MDIYQEITDRIIAEMETGSIPWHKPWMTAGAAVSHTTGKSYSLLNQMLLGKPGEYLTYKQATAEGGQVKRGEKAKMVVFWKWLEKPALDKSGAQIMGNDGKPKMDSVPFLRYYNVFHIDQCEGIKPKRVKPNEHPASPDQAAENIIGDYLARETVKIQNKEGDRAYYSPALDLIVLPLLRQFSETAEYYSTAFHEMVHSTGHASRLARLDNTANFGSESYSKEELTAEIGAAALLHQAGLETPSSFRNSAGYVQSWLKVLKGDKRFIVSAAGKADKAIGYILNGKEGGKENA